MALKFHREKKKQVHGVFTDAGLLLLRFASACLLVYYELAIHLGKAWKNVWHEEPWGLVDQLQVRGVPIPSAVSVALILTAFLAAIGVLLGFLSRINSIVLIVIFLFFLIARVETSPNLTAESLLLYVIICTTLVVTGSGKFSMDHLLTSQRDRRKA